MGEKSKFIQFPKTLSYIGIVVKVENENKIKWASLYENPSGKSSGDDDD